MIRLIPLNSTILTIPNYLYGQENNNPIILLPGGRRVFLLLYIEGSFILLPADDMTTVVNNCSHVVTRQWNGNIVLQRTAVALENVALSQQLEFYLVFCNNCLLVVQQGCKSVILAPLHIYKTLARI